MVLPDALVIMIVKVGVREEKFNLTTAQIDACGTRPREFAESLLKKYFQY